MNQNRPVNVAVIGARGIGKHHARWWTLEGAHVCAVLGTSPESVAETCRSLKTMFEFDGRAYTDLPTLLEKERPQIVDVCSPPAWHYVHSRTALEFGCHVLCEKPFLYDPKLDCETLLRQARELAALAADRGRMLGLCSQYALASRLCQRLWRETRKTAALTDCSVQVASRGFGRPETATDVWVDLAPHGVATLQAVSPRGRIAWSTLKTRFAGLEAQARFQLEDDGGRMLNCEILTGRATGEQKNLRQITLNGCRFQIEGGQDSQGQFCARILAPDGTHEAPDPMRLLIRDFLHGTPPLDGAAAVTNLEWLLRMLGQAR